MREVFYKNRLFLSVIILIAISIFYSSLVIYNSYKKISALDSLNRSVYFSHSVSSLIHSLQKERGLSAGYLLNRSDNFKNKLIQQRAISDKYIKKFKIKIKKYTKNRKLLSDINEKLKKIKIVRKDIDIGYFSYDNVIDYYSSLNDKLLKTLINITKSSFIPTISQNLTAYINFLYAKEYNGIERAVGVVILSKKEFQLKNIIRFNSLIEIEKKYIELFENYASKDIVLKYNNAIKSEPFKQVAIMEKWINNQKYLTYNVSSFVWYKLTTQKIDLLGKVATYIQKKIEFKIDKAVDKSREFTTINFLLLIASLLVFIYMLLELLKLIKDEQKLRLVMDKYVIYSITDTKGVIKDVSEAFCKISGYSKDELLNKPHNKVRHPDMDRKIFRELWDTIKSGKSWQGKIKNLRKDGSYYWVYSHMEPLYDRNGKIDAYISLRVDVTKQELLAEKIKDEEKKREAQEKMLQQQHRLAQMGEMIAMIAHQWRQPLSAISAASGALEMKAKLGKLDVKMAIDISKKIREFSNHLSSTIDDFRNFFKSDKKKERTSFSKIVDDVLKIIVTSLESNNIKLNIIKKEDEEFESYENELKQVVLNLIKNAEDALIENGVENPAIDIIIDKKNIVVMDNAGGIPKDIIDRIFDPYFSTKKKKDGTGLGLYMSKIIVQDHCGGKLTVSNGKTGAVFIVSL